MPTILYRIRRVSRCIVRTGRMFTTSSNRCTNVSPKPAAVQILFTCAARPWPVFMLSAVSSRMRSALLISLCRWLKLTLRVPSPMMPCCRPASLWKRSWLTSQQLTHFTSSWSKFSRQVIWPAKPRHAWQHWLPMRLSIMRSLQNISQMQKSLLAHRNPRSLLLRQKRLQAPERSPLFVTGRIPAILELFWMSPARPSSQHTTLFRSRARVLHPDFMLISKRPL